MKNMAPIIIKYMPIRYATICGLTSMIIPKTMAKIATIKPLISNGISHLPVLFSTSSEYVNIDYLSILYSSFICLMKNKKHSLVTVPLFSRGNGVGFEQNEHRN